jgi:hypothetical protein
MEVQTTAEQMLFATVRIEARVPDGVATGTAFLFRYTWDDRTASFLVTNKHVVADATQGRFFFTRAHGQGSDGGPMIGQRHDVWIDDFEAAWHSHPNASVDIAVMPLDPVLRQLTNEGKRAFFKYIVNDFVPTSEQAKDLDAVEEVTFIGYPNGIYDVQNLMPIVRRGITATPLQVDYDGEPKFLIDASVFPGSSGSPVFVANFGHFTNRDGRLMLGTRFLFVGVISEVAVRTEQYRIDFEPIPTHKVPIVRMSQLLNLGIVYKASTVLETIQDLLKARGEA